MTDIERDHGFDSEDERLVDDEDAVGGPQDVVKVRGDLEAPEADVLEQHLEVPLDEDEVGTSDA